MSVHFQSSNNTSLDSANLVDVLVTYRWIIVGIAMFFVILSTVAAVFLPKVYRVEALLMSVDRSSSLSGSQILGGQLGGLASLANINLGDDSQKDEAVAILKSRRFTTEFINDLNLMPILYGEYWDQDLESWKESVADDLPTLWDAVKKFDQDIRALAENRQSGVITLSIEWTNPIQSANWANELVRRVNEVIRENVVRDSEKSIEYLMLELEATNIVEIRQGIYALIEHHTQRKMLANVKEEYAFKVIDPAVAPDEDDYVSPRRLLLVFVGVVFGFVAGIFGALLIRFVQNSKLVDTAVDTT